jgi:hypothetical protein
MKFVLIACAILSLVACKFAYATPTATPPLPPPATEALQAGTLTPTTAAAIPLPFTAATYRDEDNGFEFDYPAEWNEIGGETQSRGYYQQIVSWEQPPGGITEIPEGGTVLQITVYAWEPVNDLDARLEMRRDNFTNSGNSILADEAITLASGVSGQRILVEGSEGPALLFFTTLGDLYLELSGSGDIELLDAAMRSLRIDGINP